MAERTRDDAFADIPVAEAPARVPAPAPIGRAARPWVRFEAMSAEKVILLAIATGGPYGMRAFYRRCAATRRRSPSTPRSSAAASGPGWAPWWPASPPWSSPRRAGAFSAWRGPVWPFSGAGAPSSASRCWPTSPCARRSTRATPWWPRRPGRAALLLQRPAGAPLRARAAPRARLLALHAPPERALLRGPHAARRGVQPAAVSATGRAGPAPASRSRARRRPARGAPPPARPARRAAPAPPPARRRR